MSCNGCRVLRRGCSDACTLRQCLRWIDNAEAQGHATVFVAKFFGRAGMMSLINSVPERQRPALFQSLLYEACGRTINPVFGVVGLLCSGNWELCQEALRTVMKGGLLSSASCSSGIGTGKPLLLRPAAPPSSRGCKRQAAAVDGSNNNEIAHRSSSRRRQGWSPSSRKKLELEEEEDGDDGLRLGLELTLGSLAELGKCESDAKRMPSPSWSEAHSGTTTELAAHPPSDHLLDLLH